MFVSIIITSLLVSYALAVNPTVRLDYATYFGTELSNGVNQWLGIRYAKPPLGNLRFAAPQDPDFVRGIQPANKV